MDRKLSIETAEKLIIAFQKEYILYAPKIYKNEGCYAGNDSIRYGEIHSFSEIITDIKSEYSAKEVFLPIRHTIGVEIDGVRQELLNESKPILLFLRPCDLYAVKRLDQTFAKDSFYQNRRKNAKFIIIECTSGWDSCFCVSMGTNKVNNFDGAIRFEENSILFKFSESLEKYAIGESISFELEFITENETKVNRPYFPEGIKPNIKALRELTLWQSYAKRCIGCGSCNMVCPTCTCLKTNAISSGTERVKEIRRMWNGCQVVNNAAIKGHSMPEIVPTRIMQRVLDKFSQSAPREQPCIGCGRCTDICPRLINFAQTVNRFCEAIPEEIK